MEISGMVKKVKKAKKKSRREAPSKDLTKERNVEPTNEDNPIESDKAVDSAATHGGISQHVDPTSTLTNTEEETTTVVDDTEENTKKRRKRKRKRKRDGENDDEDDDSKSNTADAAATTESKHTTSHDDQAKIAQIDRTVYVVGMPFAATPDQVRQFFVENGCADVEDLRLPTWQDSGRLLGYGHVVFASAESRTKALQELSGKYLQGRYLTIQPANKPKQIIGNSNPTESNSNPSKTLCLHNLSYQAVEEDITSVMKDFGTIVPGGVRVVRHSATGQSKGLAYVEFDNLKTAQRVYKSSTTIVICGRPCRVDYDHGRVRGSYRTADGRLWQKEYGRSSASSNVIRPTKAR